MNFIIPRISMVVFILSFDFYERDSYNSFHFSFKNRRTDMQIYKVIMPIKPAQPVRKITITEFTIKPIILNMAVDFQ